MDEQEELSPQRLQQRIQDWKERLTNLYEQISDWAANNNLKAAPGGEIVMNEELMQQMNVPTTNLPTLEIHSGNTLAISIKPKGLWVIGANGRVDLICKKGSFMLVDTAPPLETPDWKLFGPSKRDGKPFETSQLSDLI